MKKWILSLLSLGIFAVGNVSQALAQAGHEEHHPPTATVPAQPMGPGGMTGGMPGMGMGQMGGMMCPMCAQMMGGGMMEKMEGMGMMPGMGRMEMMDRPFFLDRTKELGLSDEQVAKLRRIRQAHRTDNIRTAAEMKIAGMELRDLLAGEWTLEAAEKLVRNIQKMEGDMKVRFLRAKKEAEKVLTPEQLKVSRGGEEALEGLFR